MARAILVLERLAPGFETRVNGRSIDRAPLDSGYEIALGSSLRFGYEAGAPAEPESAVDRAG
ncbi:MAG: hypothetical protein U0360_08560 [Dehalococcoidia bacterium]